MRSFIYTLTFACLVGLAFWAYQENIKTIAEIEINPLFDYRAEVSAIDVLIQVPNEK